MHDAAEYCADMVGEVVTSSAYKEALARIEEAHRTGATELNLRDIGLPELPESLRRLPGLQALNLSGNQWSVLPEWLGQLTALQDLDLSGCDLSVVPESLGRLAGLQNLNLSGCDLSVLPESLGLLTGLQDLNLSRNRLAALPASLGRLPALRRLDVSGNPLSVLPDWLGQLTSLRDLNVSGVGLSVLPDWLGQLTSLRDLNVSGVGLSALPDWLGRLTRLRDLNVSGNRLSVLPESLGQLVSLRTLELSGNRLSVLPPSLGHLTRLQDLNLSGNSLSVLPESFGRLTSLNVLRIAGNRLVHPPAEICARGTAAIVSYLQACEVEGTVRQWGSKILILGEATVGKTTLFKQLTGGPYDSREGQTHGIHIEHLRLDHPQAPDTVMELTAWDFGGQLEYRATQRFYLTNRSLFVLVWNARARYRDGKLIPWLDTIAARAPESPVLVVGTHADDATAATLPDNLGERYPQIVGVFQTDAHTGSGIKEVREAIREQAGRLPLMGASWPRSWADAARAVEALPGPAVSAAAMRGAMDKAGVGDPDAQAVIARALHDLGEIVHFADDVELSRLVVLWPAWLDERITQVLDSRPVAQARGVLSRAERRRLWNELDDLDMDERLVQMMERFDLAYRVGDRDESQDVALIVERLGEAPPPQAEASWERAGAGTREVGVVFKLKSRQAGIPTWFIARMHRYSTRQHWSHGVLLHDRALPHESWALLVDDEREQPTVSLRVRGKAPAAFLHVLTEAFRSIVEGRYPGLIEKVLVPCQCREGVGGTCGHLFDLVDLQDEVDDQDTDGKVRCQVSKTRIDAARMLYGLPGTDVARGLEQILSQLQREEKATLRVLTHVQALSQGRAQAGSICPSLFDVEDLSKTSVIHKRMIRLRLWCEWPYPGERDGQPGGPHPLPGEAGVYTMTALPDGIRRYLPYLKAASAALGAIAPVITPSLFAAASELGDRIQQGLDTTEKFLDLAGNGADVALASNLLGVGVSRPSPTTADFRRLRAALQALDPDQQWGGLEAVNRPEDQNVIFVCAAHGRALKHPFDPS